MDETTRLSSGGDRGTLAGRYQLRRLIGQGGMADVELALDTQLDREVAVKILHGRYADDPSFIARFRREAQAAANLNHPNIVAVYDAGEDDDRPFIVMEYVEGRSLRDVLRRESITPNRAIEVVGDAALALDYAHERGLVHRDVKPGNILIAQDGRVKVADFGIARAVSAETVTQTAAVFGTAAYIAPEQAQGERVDRRTDVYALGCVLYELLTGRQPFTGESAVTLAFKHVSEPPVPPSRIEPGLPPELDDVVLTAMAKDPADRYQTARELHDDLRRVEAGLPLAAAPVAYEATQKLGSDRTEVLDRPDEERVVEREELADEEAPSRRGAWILLALLLLGGALAAAYLLGAFDTLQVEIPQVRGQPINQAQTTLTEAGFETALEPRENANIPSNFVIRTDPPGGEMADEGSTVTILYSEGPPLVEIPQVRGLSRADAEAALIEAEFTVGEVRRRASAQVPADQVINSEPGQGQQAAQGSEVGLIISDGPAPVAIPRVVGLSQDEAEQVLADAELTVGAVTEEPSDEFSAGLVTRSEPAAGEEVPPGTAVGLFVSSGPATVQIPNVAGQTPEEAIATLRDAQLEVSEQREQSSDSVGEGQVIGTDPAAGESVEVGSGIALIVSTGPEQVTVPDVDGMSEDEAVQTLEEACEEPTPCLRVTVENEPSATIPEGDAIRTEPEGGTAVEPGAEVILIVSSGQESTETVSPSP